MIAVPDTSVVVDGKFKALLLDKDFIRDLERIVIAEATVAEIEHLANDGNPQGYSDSRSQRRYSIYQRRYSFLLNTMAKGRQNMKSPVQKRGY